MEIYEADSRINAAAYRTAFRAMGRAFFRSGNRSCPHFTINVVFFRLLRCVPFAELSMVVARLALLHIVQNKYICIPFVFSPPQFQDTSAQRSNVARDRWNDAV